MIQLITDDHYGDFIGEIAQMHRLRFRVFKEGLGWEVQVSGDMEIDEFDALHPVYLLQRSNDGRVEGCVRLIPTTGSTMLRDAFLILLDGISAPASTTIWESSRFALDVKSDAPKAAHGIAGATYELFAGLIELRLSRGLTEIVTVTDVRLERIVHRVGWLLRRIGQSRALGKTLAVAGLPIFRLRGCSAFVTQASFAAARGSLGQRSKEVSFSTQEKESHQSSCVVWRLVGVAFANGSLDRRYQWLIVAASANG